MARTGDRATMAGVITITSDRITIARLHAALVALDRPRVYDVQSTSAGASLLVERLDVGSLAWHRFAALCSAHGVVLAGFMPTSAVEPVSVPPAPADHDVAARSGARKGPERRAQWPPTMALRGRGRILLIGTGVAAFAAIAALLLLPHGGVGTPTRPSVGAATALASTASTTRAGGTANSGESASGIASAPSNSAVGTSVSPIASATSSTFPSDPVAAAPILLAARDACITGSADVIRVCLTALADGDPDALAAPARALATDRAVLIERVGDSALIALTSADGATKPASVLLMRTEAGWRLRAIFAG
ncbi:hypothetical protein [Gryllotalpicola sp.]|uniref:hypothetical protein n=1 Tax=Gryllotalpicola sp. TaxID=1932787 RepID=UPI00262E0E57|nr:hypothetical protein [Gryllotalpicola sp.]